MVGDLPWIEDGGTSMRSFGHGVLSCGFEHRSVVDHPSSSWCGCGCTWRIIPVSKWLITMVSKSPNWAFSPL